jgi:thiamine biosynthesis lipoprotein
MGTEYHISWVTEASVEAAQDTESISVQSQVDEILLMINKSMSTYDPESELSLLNTNDRSDWQEISEHLYRVLSMSESIHKNSYGAFDVTVGPLVNLWGFGPNKHLKTVPSADEVNASLASIGAEEIKLREIVLNKSDNVKKYEVSVANKRYIDLSAIAKGYAVDVLGRYLEGRGIKHYLVEVGGEILARGVKAKGTPWKIAIEAPTDNTRTAQLIIPLSDIGIATSGDYRNFFKQDGKRFSHTIDGRSGYPVTHGLASVTVLHESVAIADAWATALTVLGAEEGLKVAQQQGLLAFFIQRVDNGYQQSMTSQFEQLELMSSHDAKKF